MADSDWIETDAIGRPIPAGASASDWVETDAQGKPLPTPTTPLFTPPGQQPAGQAKAGLPANLPQQAVDMGLSSLPYLGAIGTGLATEGMGFLPGVVGAIAGGTGGGLIEQTGRAITGLNPPASVPEAVDRATSAGLLQGAYDAGGRPIGWGVGQIAERLTPSRIIQSTLRPGGGSQIEANKAVQTLLSEKIPLNSNALDTVNQRIQTLQPQIENLITQNPQTVQPNQLVPAVQAEMDALRAQWGKTGQDAAANLKQINEAERQFYLTHANPQKLPMKNLAQARANAGPIAAADAQAIKKATYSDIRAGNAGAYKEGANPGLATEIDQGLASAMRQNLEDLYPDIAGLNSREGDLIGLRKAVNQWSLREANKPATASLLAPAVLGLGTGLLGGPERGAEGFAATLLGRAALENPALRSRAAIRMNSIAQNPVTQAIVQTPVVRALGKIATVPNTARAAGGLLGQVVDPNLSRKVVKNGLLTPGQP